MIARIPLAEPVQPLHLYRHILREATYLPSLYQPFVAGLARQRFDASSDNIASLKVRHAKIPHTKSPRPEDRLEKALQDGIRQLRALRAVNLGDDDRTVRLMRQVFGRIGKRRRVLLNDVLRAPAPQNSEELKARLAEADAAPDAVSPLLDNKGRALRRMPHDDWNLAKFEALVKAENQQRARTADTAWSNKEMSHHNPSRVVGQLPKTNIWGEPYPLRRIRNAESRFWLEASQRVSPPVSKSEWDRLAAAAQGQLPEHMLTPKPRRAIAQSRDTQEDGAGEWDWAPYASKPVHVAEYPVSSKQWRLSGKLMTGPYVPRRPAKRQTLPKRRIHRELGRLWSATAHVDDSGGRQKFVYGATDGVRHIPAASAAQARVFAEAPSARNTANVPPRKTSPIAEEE